METEKEIKTEEENIECNIPYKVASFTSENKQTGRIIDVALWNQIDESGVQIVTIATEEGVQTFPLCDMYELLKLIQKLLDFTNN